MLDRNSRTRQRRIARTSPFAGKLFLADGTRLTPTHSRGSGGRLYRYYVPVTLQTGVHRQGSSGRLAAPAFETRIRSLLAPVDRPSGDVLELVTRIVVHEDRLEIQLPVILRPSIARILTAEQALHDLDQKTVCWSVPFHWPSREIAMSSGAHPAQRDPALIKALRTAHAMLEHDHRGDPVLTKVPRPRYERRLARLAFLSPRLQSAILQGTHPPTLTLEKIVRGRLPLSWSEQDRWARQRG